MDADAGVDVVTGAFGYTGGAIARRLLADGRRVRTLTSHPDRPSPFKDRLEVAPFSFEDEAELRRSLEGASTLYNTYWVNNVAWLLRRLPVFAIAGDGRYRVRPVHADDVADICVEAARAGGNPTVDAVGPETMTFEEMVRAIRSAVGSRAVIVHAPVGAARVAAGAIGVFVRDVLITDHELGGRMGELACTDGPTTGQTSFTESVAREGPSLGRSYASEISRHFAPA